jgi:hypothetical protein
MKLKKVQLAQMVQEGYKTYNSFTSKFLAAFATTKICDASWLMPVYFAHNLYAQYNYNKSCEGTMKLTTESKVIELIAKPTYFDAFTAYNLCALMMCGVNLLSAPLDRLLNTNHAEAVQPLLEKTSFALLSLAKTAHLFSSANSDYKFIDIATGEEISHEILLESID